MPIDIRVTVSYSRSAPLQSTIPCEPGRSFSWLLLIKAAYAVVHPLKEDRMLRASLVLVRLECWSLACTFVSGLGIAMIMGVSYFKNVGQAHFM